MRIAEENTRDNWCPLTERTKDDAGMPCLGSLCMAWRWAPDMYKCSNCGAVFNVIYPCAECKDKAEGAEMLIHRTGYCGLAGVPTR